MAKALRVSTISSNTEDDMDTIDDHNTDEPSDSSVSFIQVASGYTIAQFLLLRSNEWSATFHPTSTLS